MKLKSETTLTLDNTDMLRLVTESLGGYGVFDGMEATIVSEDKPNRSFEIVFSPKGDGEGK